MVGALPVVDWIILGLGLCLALMIVWLFWPDLQERRQSWFGNVKPNLDISIRKWFNSRNPDALPSIQWYIAVRNLSDKATASDVRVQVTSCDPISPILPLTLRSRNENATSVVIPAGTTELFDFLSMKTIEGSGEVEVWFPGVESPVIVSLAVPVSVLVGVSSETGVLTREFIIERPGAGAAIGSGMWRDAQTR